MKAAKTDVRTLQIKVLLMLTVVLSSGTKADFSLGPAANLGPAVNSVVQDGGPSISADGLSLYLYSFFKGFGNPTLRVATRTTLDEQWGEAESLPELVNSGSAPCISYDALELYHESFRSGGMGSADIWVTTRAEAGSPWRAPVNLGSAVNSSSVDMGASISADGLELYFGSDRPGGRGDWDIYIARRATISSPWGTSQNLGPTVNGSSYEGHPCITRDGLMLFFCSTRPGGYGDFDLWVAMRATREDDWGTPVNLGPTINTAAGEAEPSISTDGKTLYFSDWNTPHAGGVGSVDLWQAPILPEVDFSGNGVVDCDDLHMMGNLWLTGDPSCDVGPMPWGDGIVDAHDFAVLAGYWLEDVGLVAHWKLDETQGTVAHDSVGTYDGSLHGGAVWQPTGGMVDGALSFDGADDYVSTPFVWNPRNDNFSVFAWVKTDTAGKAIISQMGTNGSSWLAVDAEGRLTTELQGSGRGAAPLAPGTVITDNQWHRVGFTWDGAHRALYVDGVEVARDSSTQSITGADGGLHIGADKGPNASSFFRGLIDDAKVYNRVVVP